MTDVNRPTYKSLSPQVDLPALDHGVLDLWAEQRTFDKSLERTRDGKRWVFYEGPPTANGTPGTHHVEARVFKDVFPRFKTMQGFRVDRKAGWDCHGLPVEIAVEKELGFNGKADIEAYGVGAFNERCRESVLRNVDAFAEMTTRMGYWVNLDEAYRTMDPSYVESVWWALKQIFDKGLLVEDYRVAPYCPRCGTTLSDHELAQGYEDVTDPSVYVRMPLLSGPWAGRAALLVWTTTPWTLVSNTAVAVHPDVTYVVADNGTEALVVASPLVDAVLGEGWVTRATYTGREMEFWAYQRPFELIDFPDPTSLGAVVERPDTPTGAHYVVLAEYVTTEDGTGLVHQAPAFGADDLTVSRAYGLPMVNPITPDGAFDRSIPLVGGVFFKTADRALTRDLAERGLLYRELPHEHSYPHCWRCGTPLLYYAQPSWYIRTTQVKEALLAQNELTTWYPENIKEGRYGDWLHNNIDWALSRKRYWGTPLPIWRNDIDPSRMVCVGSRAELGELAGQDLLALDPHRPFVDDVTFTRPGEEGTYRRVPEVIDAWFDSGSMPFAQWGYPYAEGSGKLLAETYPADFIAEGLDQTRGWFYTLMAVGTLVFGQSSYRNVLCLGLLLAEDGKKMSKHLGNILLPVPLMEAHGADALRWFMAAGGSPWSARRVGNATLQEIVRKVLLTYWNTASFQALYARSRGWTPTGTGPGVADRHVLDRWLASATNALVRDVTAALDDFDTLRAGTLLAQFVDDLSNWYVRRSRKRFAGGDQGALWTLHEALDVLTRLMAPIAPFVTERVWQDLFVATNPEGPASVHLADWPTVDEAAIDEGLNASMTTTRRLVELGRAARAASKIRTRQPLARALVPTQAFEALDEALVAELRAELNVVSVESFAGAGDLVDYAAKGNFRALGKRFGARTPLVAAAIADADAAALAAALARDGRATVAGFEVLADEVLVSERPREGWSVVNDQGETIALDLELTPALVEAGHVREAIRQIQETRKATGLEVSDRIDLLWHATGAFADALRAQAAVIADEVLADSVAEGTPDATWSSDPDLGLAIKVARA